jgi:hypothetical protein
MFPKMTLDQGIIMAAAGKLTNFEPFAGWRV